MIEVDKLRDKYPECVMIIQMMINLGDTIFIC